MSFFAFAFLKRKLYAFAKALFDYLYLRPLPGNITSPCYDLAEELRLNLDEFTTQERQEFAGYVVGSDMAKMGSMKIRRILKNLESHVWRP